MNTSGRTVFILVDDDTIHNAVSRLTITNVALSAEVVIFTDPEVALRFLEDFASHSTEQAILLLNLNMPFMSGWEFLENFTQLDIEVKKRFRIYIISASINEADRVTAESHSAVSGYISKPLSAEMVMKL